MTAARSRGARAAFTLVEVLVAMGILALAGLSAATFLAQVRRGGVLAERYTQATLLAQDKMDELMTKPYAAVSSGADSTGSYRRVWTVTAASTNRAVLVTVSWPDIDGYVHRVVFNGWRAP